MSIFPTKVLLATDGSNEADLAAWSAAELADKTGSELHVVHVFGISPWYPAYPEATRFDGVELEDPVLEEDLQRISEQRARELLDAEAEKLRSVGGTPAQAHLAGRRRARGDRWVGRGDRGWACSGRQQGTRRDPKSFDRQRLRFSGAPRPLPCAGGARR